MSGKSSADIERDVEKERAELVGTLDQLRENLRPENVVDEVMAHAQVTASDMSDRLWRSARDNPIPATLISIGAAMLMNVSDRVAARRGRARGGAADDRVRRYDILEHRAAAAETRIRDSAQDLRSQAMRPWTNQTIPGEAKMTQFPRSRTDVVRSLSRLIDEQPLIIAALGIAVGAAVGAAIPSSDTERQWMGDAAGSVKGAARDMARDQVDQLKQTAAQTFDEVKRTASEHGLSTDNLSGLVRDVGANVRTAASDVGDQLSHGSDSNKG